jgi:hypothetical protein
MADGVGENPQYESKRKQREATIKAKHVNILKNRGGYPGAGKRLL